MRIKSVNKSGIGSGGYNHPPETVRFVQTDHEVNERPILASSYHHYTSVGVDSWLFGRFLQLGELEVLLTRLASKRGVWSNIDLFRTRD